MSENEPYLRRLRQYRRIWLSVAILLVAGLTAFSYLNGLSPVGSLLVGALGLAGAALLIVFGFRVAEDMHNQIQQGVAERVQAEEALQEAQRRFRTLLDNVRLIAVGLDGDGNVAYANPYFLELTGFTQDEVLGEDWFENFIPERDRPAIGTVFSAVLESGLAPHHENPILTKEGKERLIAWNNTVLWGPDGRPAGTMSIGEDITERRRAEETLQRSTRELEALYQTSLEINAQRAADLLGAPMGSIYLMQPDGQSLELVVDCNLPGQWAGTTLRLGEGVSGRAAQIREVLMVEDHRKWEGQAQVYADSPFRRVLAVPLIVGDHVIGVLDLTDTERTGPYSEEEVRLASLFADQAAIAIENARLYEEIQRHAAELEQRVAERTTQLRERAAEVEQTNRALANLLEDIQASNASLTEATEKLKEVNEELEAFGYSVSHDLRAPLRAMQGFARALLEDAADQLDETSLEYARRIVSAGQRMDVIIMDLLAYGRVAHTEIELRPTSLETAVAQALSALQAEAEERGAQIAVERPLPQVLAHGTTLAQVIGNLISNALKFTAPDVTPQVRVWAEERGAAVRLWVQDNGIGIAPQHRQRIFRVFERLHGVEAYPGTGIGLAIVRKGVERMGGRVGVESEVGKGSRFWIELRKEG